MQNSIDQSSTKVFFIYERKYFYRIIKTEDLQELVRFQATYNYWAITSFLSRILAPDVADPV